MSSKSKRNANRQKEAENCTKVVTNRRRKIALITVNSAGLILQALQLALRYRNGRVPLTLSKFRR